MRRRCATVRGRTLIESRPFTHCCGLAAADTAPSFGGDSVSAQYFRRGAAIVPFQIPAATGGNGATYTAANLPPGLKLDATYTDASGYIVSDFPVGMGAPGRRRRGTCDTVQARARFPAPTDATQCPPSKPSRRSDGPRRCGVFDGC